MRSSIIEEILILYISIINAKVGFISQVSELKGGIHAALEKAKLDKDPNNPTGLLGRMIRKGNAANQTDLGELKQKQDEHYLLLTSMFSSVEDLVKKSLEARPPLASFGSSSGIDTDSERHFAQLRYLALYSPLLINLSIYLHLSSWSYYIQ